MTTMTGLQHATRGWLSCGEDCLSAGLQDVGVAGNSREGTNVPERRCGSKRPTAAIGLWYMMSFAVALVGFVEPPNLEAAPGGAAGAPLVVHADDWEPPTAITEADVLTLRILQRSGAGFGLDAPQARELASEIERVLSRIRGAHPVVKGVTVRGNFDPWTLLLGLEPDLYGKVSRAVSPLNDEGGPAPLHTGHELFDTLNTESGLAAVKLYPFMSVALFRFNEPIDPVRLPFLYSSLEGVRYAEPDSLHGDGPDVEAWKSQGTWYFVFRKAWGDCPSGCIHDEIFFFIVEEDEVERIGSARAMDMPMFAKIVEGRGRRWRP